MRRTGALAALLVILAIVSIGASGPARARPADGTTGGSATLTPSEGLIDLQISHVVWQGLPASKPVYVAQCIASPTDATTDCSFPRQPFGTAYANSDSHGAGTVPVQVHFGDLGTPSGGTITCSDQKACSVGLFQQSLDVSGAVFVPFSLAPEPMPCPPSKGQGSIQAQGTASAFRPMAAWTAAACKLSPPLSVTYTLTDDVTAPDALLAGSTDLAVTGFPLTRQHAATLDREKRPYSYAPLSLSGLVFAYNMYDTFTHQQITNLKLTPRIIAEIFTNKVFSWICPPSSSCKKNGGDPAIHKLNPRVHFPSGVQAFVLAGHSGQTLEFTQWMTALAHDVYKGGPQDTWGNTGVPQNGNIFPITDPNSEGLAVATPDSAQYDVNGYIGVMDSTTAALYGLPTVALQANGSPGKFVSASQGSVRAALTHARTNPDGVTLAPNYRTKDPSAYPLPYVAYGVIPRSYFSVTRPIPNSFLAADGATLSSFLKYVMSPTGQKALPLGSFALPQGLMTDALKALTTKAPPVPIAAPSPPPSPSPSVPVSTGGGTPGGGTGGTGTGPNGGGPTRSPTPKAPTPTPQSPAPSPTPTYIYPLASSRLPSHPSSAVVPILAVLAVLGLIVAPMFGVVARAPALVRLPGRLLNGIGRRRRSRAKAADEAPIDLSAQ